MKAFTYKNAATALAAALLTVCCALVQQSSFTQKDFERLKPITGTWLTQRKNGNIYEYWARKSKTEFSGMSYTLAGTDTVPLEKVSLYLKSDEIVYAPVAFGQNDEKEVLFKLTAIEGNRFVFENPAHDFPQRIVYDFRSVDSLYAYIEGTVKSQRKRVDYPYRRLH